MAKFHGVIGYAETVETSPGVWTEQITERTYSGDVTRNISKWDSGENLNDNLNINNAISVLADAYAYQYFSAIRYVEWMGTKWKVSSVEVNRPRLTLNIGGVYNGDET
ncbi:MAG: hypothetical protein LUF78_10805 [Clostridiales bacterium]|nr:hypothetical protein [Clostridiales bacterium]